MKKIVLFLILISSYAYAQCEPQPSCDELGFTDNANACKGKALKCPFDNTKAFCGEVPKPNCNMGDIVYSDQTCSSTYNSSKTPVGVVFNTSRRYALALKTDYNNYNNCYQNCTIGKSGSSILPDISSEWFLPSEGVNYAYIQPYVSNINVGLSRVGGAQILTSQYYWADRLPVPRDGDIKGITTPMPTGLGAWTNINNNAYCRCIFKY